MRDTDEEIDSMASDLDSEYEPVSDLEDEEVDDDEAEGSRKRYEESRQRLADYRKGKGKSEIERAAEGFSGGGSFLFIGLLFFFLAGSVFSDSFLLLAGRSINAEVTWTDETLGSINSPACLFGYEFSPGKEQYRGVSSDTFCPDKGSYIKVLYSPLDSEHHLLSTNAEGFLIMKSILLWLLFSVTAIASKKWLEQIWSTTLYGPESHHDLRASRLLSVAIALYGLIGVFFEMNSYFLLTLGFGIALVNVENRMFLKFKERVAMQENSSENTAKAKPKKEKKAP